MPISSPSAESPRRASGPVAVFSDLDGTLLDAKTYRFDAALPALAGLLARRIPLVICSSKTRREVEAWQGRLGTHDPFIFENGGGICVPQGVFPFAVEGKEADGRTLIALGTPYSLLRSALRELREGLGVRVTGFGDLSAAGVAALTGLPPADVDLARQREFDEPFVFDDPHEPRKDEFLRAVEDRGLRWTRGAFFHLLGDNDKGAAVRILAGFYRRTLPGLVTVGLGDAPNDLPLLGAVDVPVLVQRADGTYAEGTWPSGTVYADGPGPRGWNVAILGMLG